MAFILRVVIIIEQTALGVLFLISVKFCIVISLFDYFTSVSHLFVNILNVFSRPYVSESYCGLLANHFLLGILVSITLTLVTNLSHTIFFTSLLSTLLLKLLKSTRTVLSFSTSALCTLVFKI